MHQQIAFDIAKRDAIRIFCDRLFEQLEARKFNVGEGQSDEDRAYRRGWNDAITHIINHISR